MGGIEFSLCLSRYEDEIGLQKVLRGFGQPCQLQTFLWEEEQSELLRIAISKQGPDLSQIGAPTVGNLIAMGVLRPFHEDEVAALGGASAFSTAAWQNARRTG